MKLVRNSLQYDMACNSTRFLRNIPSICHSVTKYVDMEVAQQTEWSKERIQ